MKKFISAAEFDKRFDNGEDISEYVDYEYPIKLEKLLSKEEVTLPLGKPPMKKLAQKSSI